MTELCMPKAQKDRIIENFKKVDLDKNGELSMDEIKAIFKKCDFAEDAIDSFLRKFDLNGDQKVSLGELKLALGYAEVPIGEWRTLFRELDANGNGKVSVKELTKKLNDWGRTDLVSILTYWIDEYDVDGDGELTFQEFLGFAADAI